MIYMFPVQSVPAYVQSVSLIRNWRWFDWFEPLQINHLYSVHTFNVLFTEVVQLVQFKPLQINHLYWYINLM